MPDVTQTTEMASWALKLWNFRLFVYENSPITVGQLILGIFLLLIGYFISKYVSSQTERRLLARLDIDASLKHTLKMIIFYCLFIISTLFVLRLLNVPITIFAVLGGALAVGLGLGSQEIVKDFLSGIIIMIERPVRVGDLMQVDGLYGTVEHIGSRATRIKSMDNTHIVVPNNFFLSNKVLNWTLSDDVIRTHIKVGVAYGSPTRKVEELILQAASEMKDILKYPEAYVIFDDFGDSSLGFVLYFWTRVPTMIKLRKLESEVRYKIDDLFRESDIMIAFPQRDIHLDTIKPLQVEVMESH